MRFRLMRAMHWPQPQASEGRVRAVRGRQSSKRSELEQHGLCDLVRFCLADEQLREPDGPLSGRARPAARHQVPVHHHALLRVHVRAALLHCRARRRVRCHFAFLAHADAVRLECSGTCKSPKTGKELKYDAYK